jgi:hypothetical protein
MTLCGGLLEDANDLKRLLCVTTKNAFLSKPMAATTIKAFASATPALGTPQLPVSQHISDFQPIPMT